MIRRLISLESTAEIMNLIPETIDDEIIIRNALAANLKLIIDESNYVWIEGKNHIADLMRLKRSPPSSI